MKTIGISWSDKDRTPAEVKASGHTPGPWRWSTIALHNPERSSLLAGNGEIAVVEWRAFGEGADEANARLIAKAPTMYELLTIIATEVETECTCDANRDKCLHCRIVECLEGK